MKNAKYVPPIEAERHWGLVHALRGAVFTACAWATVVEMPTVLLLFIYEGTKDLFVHRYIQTVRNVFRGEDSRPWARFGHYYCRRLASNLVFASLTMLIAWGSLFFTPEKILHLITSRIGNSSHYLVGFAEAEIIAAGILSRQHISHLTGSLSLFGSVVASLDLAGVTLMGVRPFWFNIATSVLLLTYYGLQALLKPVRA